MTSIVLTENRHSGGFMVSEAPGEQSFDQVTLLQQSPSGTLTQAGTVLGEILVGTSAVYAAAGGNTGTFTCSAVTLAQGAVEGAYSLVFISPTQFNVFYPNGELVGEGVVGTAFSGGGIGFTITQGAFAPATGTFAALGTNTGNPTCGTVTVASPLVAGEYDIVMDSATLFTVFNPGGRAAGDELGHGVFGTAFSVGGLGFTITAGGTACVAADSFKITVAGTGSLAVPGDEATITLAANSNVGLYNALSLTAADGTQNVAAIIYNTIDASGANTPVTVVHRNAEVNGSELIYPSGASTSQIAAINAQLATLGIIVR